MPHGLYIKKGLNFTKKHLFDLFVLLIFSLSLTGYVFYLKSGKTRTLFVETSIQKPDWWQGNSQIPTDLLTTVKNGDTDGTGTLKVVEFKYFPSEIANWEVNSPERNIGRILLEMKSSFQSGKSYYNGQELYVGSPLVVVIGKTRFELLVTDISDTINNNNFVKRKILVRIYDKYPEQTDFIKQGMEFKDNDGFVYATVISIQKEHTRIITADQMGKPHAERDPWKFDLNIIIETLASEKNSRLTGYDGRAISLGRKFIFGLPEADDVGAYIVGIY